MNEDEVIKSLNEGLEPIEPLIDYYTREMGQLGGRLMTALSLLTDLEDSYGWNRQSAQARETVRYSRLLVAEVLRIVASAQPEDSDDTGLGAAVQAMLDQLARAERGV